ncbi:MAG: DsrE family protein [Rhodocyclaceae bacterium]|nr:DsrE family protein [Rhodocyclaceae bacterium]
MASDALDRLAILVWAAEPDRPQRCATPFYFATAAAAMDCEVEMYFTAGSVRLLEVGTAESLHADASASKSVAAFLREAHALGVRMFACPTAVAACELSPLRLRPECAGQAGAASYLGRVLDPAWRTMEF